MQPVVARIVEAAERQRRTELVAFGGVVVDDVEDHLDAGGVQRGARRCRISLAEPSDEIARLDGEEAERIVAPVVAQLLLEQMTVLHEGMDRQQLDGRDAEPAQVVDHRTARARAANVPRSRGRRSSRSMRQAATCAS